MLERKHGQLVDDSEPRQIASMVSRRAQNKGCFLSETKCRGCVSDLGLNIEIGGGGGLDVRSGAEEKDHTAREGRSATLTP